MWLNYAMTKAVSRNYNSQLKGELVAPILIIVSFINVFQ